jgi:hypothetical protein
MLPVVMKTGMESDFSIRQTLLNYEAVRSFEHAHAKSWFYRIWALVTRRSFRALDLKDICAACIYNRRYDGVQTVRIDQIRGSENRSDDFDIHFNPIHSRHKERWVNVARAMLGDAGVPPVELIKVHDTYFVRDGHHRISVARSLGQEEIDAVVTNWDVSTCGTSQKSA